MRLDGVEIKVNVAETHVVEAMDLLKLDDQSTFQIWFYEDRTPGIPELALLNAGLIVRVRAKDSGDLDATVKLRPCRRSQLTDTWLSRESEGNLEFKVEEDRSSDSRVLAASCQIERDKGAVPGHEGSPFLLSEVLSDKQIDFLDTCATLRVNVAELTALGPIDATRWDEIGVPEFADLKARAERWVVAGHDFLEISIKADPDDATAKGNRLQELITQQGITLDTSQDSKTRRVLTALL